MIYPDNFEQKLGFDQVRQALEAQCLGPDGRELARSMRISTKAGVVEKWQAQVADAARLLQEGLDFLSGYYPALDSVSKKLEIEGAFLVEQEWADLVRLLENVQALHRFERSTTAAGYLHLPALVQGIMDPGPLMLRIRQVFDENGQVRDSASSELQRLRRQLVDEHKTLRRKLDSILRQSIREGYSPEGSELTVRSGRLVIPVVAEHKRRIKGFIHDESSTGQTVFLEPGEVLEANNLIRELEYEERREILRILMQLTQVARGSRDDIASARQKVGLLDFVRAKGKYALATKSILPEITRDFRLSWRDARNPVLEEALNRHKKKIVPLTVSLDKENRILVISGPNAGGKSVSLKTMGLLQYMVQFGLHIPALEGSKCPVFESFFIDIGDEQSMENDLSTYSSHLRHMRQFLQHCGPHSFFLIDEFGTGTDPAYGGAIAGAVLEELNVRRSFGVVTTHFSSLKEMASHTAGLFNGSMRFDMEHLAPLYQLQAGQPGSSFALEIAQKNGLPPKVLAKAREYTGQERIQADTLLSGLERERQQIDSLKAQLKGQNELTDKLRTEYEQIKTYLEGNRRHIINEARQQAKQLILDANRKIEETIRTIRESQADKELTKLARVDLKEFEDEKLETEIIPEEQAAAVETAKAKKDKTKVKPVVPVKLEGPVQVGDTVLLVGGESQGTVLEIKGKNARVQFGAFVTQAKADQLVRVKGQPKKQQTEPFEKVGGVVGGLDINRKQSEFSQQLDVRGLYPTEAMAEVEQYMDDALILGLREVRIVHGKGNGVLKQQIRQQLKGYSQIESLEWEHADRGGEGVTIVRFR